MSRKTAKPYVPSRDEKVAALSDVAYEIEQILLLCCTWPVEAGLQQNAWLEAILIHTRQLLDFFEHSRRSVSKGRENEDILAIDFSFTAQPINVDPVFRERLNKDLAHLSYSRQQRIAAKSWNLNDLRPLLARNLQFAEHVVRDWSEFLAPDQVERWAALTTALGRALGATRPFAL